MVVRLHVGGVYTQKKKTGIPLYQVQTLYSHCSNSFHPLFFYLYSINPFQHLVYRLGVRPSPVRSESELTLSFALTMQIQRNMAGSLRRRHCENSQVLREAITEDDDDDDDSSVYPPSWPKSLLHAASHSSHMMSTPLTSG